MKRESPAFRYGECQESYLDGEPVVLYDALADMQTGGFVEDNLTVVGNIIDNPEILTDYLCSIAFDR